MIKQGMNLKDYIKVYQTLTPEWCQKIVTATNNLTLTAAPRLSVNSISVSPNIVNASASYNLNVLIGTTVAIGETITLTFPTNVYLPTPFSKNYIIIDIINPLPISKLLCTKCFVFVMLSPSY